MGLAVGKTHSSYEELLAKVSDIRTLPMVAVKVNELINDPNSSSSDIADVLKKDQVLSSHFLFNFGGALLPILSDPFLVLALALAV